MKYVLNARRGFVVALIAALLLFAVTGCAVTADRYKVPVMSVHNDGNPDYQCKDGYFKARDSRGVQWCDRTDEFDRYPLKQEVDRCDGVTLSQTNRLDECLSIDAVEEIFAEMEPDETDWEK